MASKNEPLTDRQQFWREHLRRCEAAGQTVRAYAFENNLSAFALYDARRTMKQSQGACIRAVVRSPSSSSPRFVRVTAPAPAASATLPCRAHLRNGVVVEIGVAANELGVVLRDLASLP